MTQSQYTGMDLNKLISVKIRDRYTYSDYGLSADNYRRPVRSIDTQVNAYRMSTWDVRSIGGNDSLVKYKSVVEHWPLQDIYAYGNTLNDIHLFKNMPVNTFMFEDHELTKHYKNYMRKWPLNKLEWNTFYSEPEESYNRLYNLIKNNLPFSNIRSLTIINTHDPSGGFNELARAIALMNLGTLNLGNIPINYEIMEAINKSGVHKLTMGGFIFDEKHYDKMMDAAGKATVTDLTLTCNHDIAHMMSFPKLTKLSILGEYDDDVDIDLYISFIKRMRITHLDVDVNVRNDRLIRNLPKTLKHLEVRKSVVYRYKHLFPPGLKYKISFDDTDD